MQQNTAAHAKTKKSDKKKQNLVIQQQCKLHAQPVQEAAYVWVPPPTPLLPFVLPHHPNIPIFSAS